MFVLLVQLELKAKLEVVRHESNDPHGHPSVKRKVQDLAKLARLHFGELIFVKVGVGLEEQQLVLHLRFLLNNAPVGQDVGDVAALARTVPSEHAEHLVHRLDERLDKALASLCGEVRRWHAKVAQAVRDPLLVCELAKRKLVLGVQDRDEQRAGHDIREVRSEMQQGLVQAQERGLVHELAHLPQVLEVAHGVALRRLEVQWWVCPRRGGREDLAVNCRVNGECADALSGRLLFLRAVAPVERSRTFQVGQDGREQLKYSGDAFEIRLGHFQEQVKVLATVVDSGEDELHPLGAERRVWVGRRSTRQNEVADRPEELIKLPDVDILGQRQTKVAWHEVLLFIHIRKAHDAAHRPGRLQVRHEEHERHCRNDGLVRVLLGEREHFSAKSREDRSGLLLDRGEPVLAQVHAGV
mmetsp:Transcript_12447/g.39757  ORF Transcript_12447/g.39757 Transcript_12447/m.39757 type:complete len:412 (-) Transcript_12447:406-1641(-)